MQVITDEKDPKILTLVTNDGGNLHVHVHLLKIFTIPEAKRILSLIPRKGITNRKARHIFATALVDLQESVEKAREIKKRKRKERDGGG